MDGVSRATINTLGGKTAENRGRRGDTPAGFNLDSPYEDGQLSDGWANRLTHQGKGPKGYKRQDKSIYEDVCEVLAASPYVDASHMEVEVKDGCVYLRGQIHDRKMKKMAELVLDHVAGIQDIQNLLILSRRDYVKERQ